MLSITDNFLYVIDAEGRQQIFDTDKLKSALQNAFESSGNPNGYLAEDIACAVEAAMAESARIERIFTQSEVDAAVSRILENAGYAQVSQLFRRANSHLYISMDACRSDAQMLISRHLGVNVAAAEKLANQVVDALEKLHIPSASPALYLELARYYEHAQDQPAAAALTAPMQHTGKFLLKSSDAASLATPAVSKLLEQKIIAVANVSALYPNFRISLNLTRLSESLALSSPVTELALAPALYQAGADMSIFLNLLCRHLQRDDLPLYLVLTELDVFAERYLGTGYPEGRLAALEIAALFRNALGYPVKKVRCRTTSANRSAN